MLSRRTASKIKSIKTKRLALAYKAIKSLYPLLDEIRNGLYEGAKLVKGLNVVTDDSVAWNTGGRIVGELGAKYSGKLSDLQNSAPQVTSFQEFRILLKGFELMDSNPEAILEAAGGDLYTYLNIVSGQVAGLIDKLAKLNLKLSSDAATVLREAVSSMTDIIEDKSRNKYNGAYIIDNLIEVWNAINERYPFEQFKKLASGWEAIIQNLFQVKELFNIVKARKAEYDVKRQTLRDERTKLEDSSSRDSWNRLGQIRTELEILSNEEEQLNKTDDAVITRLTRQAATWFLKLADTIEQNSIDLTNVSEAGKSIRSNKFVTVKGVNRRVSLGEFYATIRSVIKEAGDVPDFQFSMSMLKEQMAVLNALEEVENQIVDTASEISGKDYNVGFGGYSSRFTNKDDKNLEHWLGAEVIYELSKDVRAVLELPFWKHMIDNNINKLFTDNPREIIKAQSAVELANLNIMQGLSKWKESTYGAFTSETNGEVIPRDIVRLLKNITDKMAYELEHAANAIRVARSLVGNNFKIPEMPKVPSENMPSLYDTRGRSGGNFGSGDPYRRSISKKSIYNKAKRKALAKIRQRLLN